MNVFDKLNELNKADSIEADAIADSIPKFILDTPNASQMKNIELYNLWLQRVGIIPSGDEVARWALEFISYVAKDVPVELLKLQVESKN